MGIVNRPNSYSSNTTISSSEVNDDLDTIYNEFNGSIEAANLASSAVVTAKIADSNVTTAKIADSNVTTAKIADGAVTSEKLDSTIAARAYLNSAQTVTDNVATKVQLNAESYDVGSDYDTTNHRFTAPVTGYYSVNAAVTGTSLADTTALVVMIYVNGAEYTRVTTRNSVAAGNCSTNISDIVPATSGQYIELYTIINSDANEALTTGALETWMSISFVGV